MYLAELGPALFVECGDAVVLAVVQLCELLGVDLQAAVVELEQDNRDVELVVVAFGTMARFVRYVVNEMRGEGVRVGWFRPVTLWPFPSEALLEHARGSQRVAVLEQNAGQMIEDVRLSVLGACPVRAIGGISSDAAGFGIGPILDADVVRERVTCALEERELPA